jgi:hypothetical protein
MEKVQKTSSSARYIIVSLLFVLGQLLQALQLVALDLFRRIRLFRVAIVLWL